MTACVKIQSAAALFIACLGLLPVVSPAAGQSRAGGHMMIVNRNDDGSGEGPQIMHFSMPDVFALRQPDFLKRDLPIFRDKLVLSEAQQAAMERHVEKYLEEFEALKKEKMPSAQAGPMVFALGGGEDGPIGLALAHENPDELPELALGEWGEMEGDLAPGMGMDIGVRVTAAMPAGGGEAVAMGDAADGEPQVAIQVASANGAEIPEDLRKKLEERAAEMAEKIKQQVEARLAEGQQPDQAAGEGLAAMEPLMGANIEELQRRQQEMAEQAEAFAKAKTELRQKFVAEAQTQLAEPQVERWPALERALLREKSLPKGRVPGERTDLFKVAKSAGLDESHQGTIAPQLDQYDLALDGALRQRNDFVDDAGDKVDKALQEKNFDKALSIVDRATALRLAVRSVNEQFTQAIAALLPPDKAESFRSAVLKASYPMVYRKTFANKTFEAASKIEGVDENTLAAINELSASYQLELTQVNEQIRKAIDLNDPKEPRRPIEHMKQMAAGTPPEEAMTLLDDPEAVKKAFGKRRELDLRYAKFVSDLLTPEQREQLPKPPPQRTGEPIIIRRAVEN